MINAGIGEQLEAVVAVFGTTTRLGILKYLLSQGPAQMGTIAADLGVARVTVTKAILALEDLGVVIADTPRESRAGKRVLYHINAERIRSLLDALNGALDMG